MLHIIYYTQFEIISNTNEHILILYVLLEKRTRFHLRVGGNYVPIHDKQQNNYQLSMNSLYKLTKYLR